MKDNKNDYKVIILNDKPITENVEETTFVNTEKESDINSDDRFTNVTSNMPFTIKVY